MHYFYAPDISQPFVTLSNEESEHCVRVMRHREGDAVCVTDGRGHLAEAVVVEAHPKKCLLEIRQHITDNLLTHNGLHLAIAPTKNADRKGGGRGKRNAGSAPTERIFPCKPIACARRREYSSRKNNPEHFASSFWAILKIRVSNNSSSPPKRKVRQPQSRARRKRSK